ncbi:hypothetical protein WG902_16645 [Ramlibacter sp. PS3R-8]|uniref:hypothetical protein n=1 Tax=Ramlibacter sp. PS3R-8 TaxID=3133437 RepID=UPI0030956414
MNTQTQLHALQAGEALAFPGSSKGRVILIEGEVLVQAPALYLAGTAILPPERRLSAPATLTMAEAGSLRVTRSARLVVEAAPGLGATIKSALARLRRRYPVAIASAGAGAQRT